MVNNAKIGKWYGVALALLIINTTIFMCACSEKTDATDGPSAKAQRQTIKVSGAFALYPLMGMWAEEYQKENKNVKIDVSAGGAGKGMADTIQGIVDIGMVSRGIYQSEIDQGILWVAVAKDAVIATISSSNPVRGAILTRGISKETFESIFISRDAKTWGAVSGDASLTAPIRVYTRSDACGAAQTWAEYLGRYTQDDLTNAADSAINGDPSLAAAVQGDSLSIGYNNINFVYDANTRRPFAGLVPVPIDINGNGRLDDDERVYDTLDDIVDAIGKNIYPSPPARDLYLVTGKDLSEPAERFIRWILTEGQRHITVNGYIILSDEVISEQLVFLDTKQRPEMRAGQAEYAEDSKK